MRPKTTLRLLLALGVLFAVGSCGDPKKSARGFRLPDGDVDRGQGAFVALECHRCHSVDGVELAEYAGERPLTLRLGGEVYQVKNYGQLVTSIINPQHIVSPTYLARLPKEERENAKGESPMPAFNGTMTVTQMIDLVAFLQSRYKKLEPEYDDYGYYGP